MPNIDLGGRGFANSSVKPCMCGWLFFFKNPDYVMLQRDTDLTSVEDVKTRKRQPWVVFWKDCWMHWCCGMN